MSSVPRLYIDGVYSGGSSSVGSLNSWFNTRSAVPCYLNIDVAGAGYWNSSVFEQAFRDNLCGSSGQVVSFGSSYPSTVEIELAFGTSGMVEGNASLAVFLQGQSTKEVYNAWFMAVMDIPYNTSTENEEYLSVNEIDLTISPNPSSGAFSVSYSGVIGMSASLSLYDISGRLIIQSGLTSEETPFSLSNPGVYLVVLNSSNGTISTERIVITR